MLEAFAKLPLWQRLLGFVVVGAVIGVIWYMFFYVEAVDHRVAAQTALKTAQAELELAEEARKNFAAKQAEVEAAEKKLAEQREILPLAAATVDNLMQTFQQQSRLVGMTVESWTNENESREDFSARMPIKIRATGTWPQVGEFFRRASELKRIVSVEKLALKLRPNQKALTPGEHPLLDVEFEAATYRFLSDAERAAEAEKGVKKKGRRRK